MVDDFKTVNLGASFNMGFLKISGDYNKVDYGKSDQKTVLLGVAVPFGQSTLKASYNKASGSIKTAAGTLVQDQGAKLFAFGYQYDLSKRTSLYATLSSLNNDGNTATGAKFTVGQGPALAVGGDTSKGYNVGVRHSF
jgi:predicted porin